MLNRWIRPNDEPPEVGRSHVLSALAVFERHYRFRTRHDRAAFARIERIVRSDQDSAKDSFLDRVRAKTEWSWEVCTLYFIYSICRETLIASDVSDLATGSREEFIAYERLCHKALIRLVMSSAFRWSEAERALAEIYRQIDSEFRLSFER